MAYEQRDDSFTLFRNDRKEKPSHPDYRGDGMVGGRTVRVSAWIKEDRNGRKFMSCSVSDKDAQPSERQTKPEPAFQEDVPF